MQEQFAVSEIDGAQGVGQFGRQVLAARDEKRALLTRPGKQRPQAFVEE